MTERESLSLESFKDNYRSIEELLARRDQRIVIAPWDKLDLPDLDPDTVPKRHAVDARQIHPIEQILQAYHQGMTPQGSSYEFYPIDYYKRGTLGGVDVHSGTIELDIKEEFSPVRTMFFQYVHNPREGYDENENFIMNNDGVANVFLQSDGRMQAFAMLPSASSPALYFPFAPDGIRQRELPYPQGVSDAEESIRNVHTHISPQHLPLMSKLGRMVTAASDIWLDRQTNYQPTETLMKISGDIVPHRISKEGMDRMSADFFGAPSDEHPLAGLVDASLIPDTFDVIEMEKYEEFIKLALQNGYKLPSFFRSHEMGLYFSEASPFDDEAPGSHMQEILGYNGVTDVSRGLIVPSQFPTGYKGEWNNPLSYLRHQMMLAVYEDLPDEVRESMLVKCSELVERSVELLNHTYLSPEIPALDASSPYAFKNYSHRQQEKILGGFIAGIMTMNKDLFPYWAGPPLRGDGSSRLNWVTEGMADLLEENGFYVSQVPASKIHPLYMRGFNRDGTSDMSDRPFANPDLRIDNLGVIFPSTGR